MVICCNEGLSGSKGQKPTVNTQAEANPEDSGEWTDTVSGHGILRLYGLGPAGQHPVWEGPVEIGSMSEGYFFKIDLELVDSI